MTVGIAILTLNAARDLPRLWPLIAKEGADRVVVFDSSSNDGTPDWVRQQAGLELETIARADFNHGATREYARKHLGTDIVVMLTQDVLPRPGWLAALTRPLREGSAVVAYARQLPHDGADVFEAFPREFNYPAQSNRRTLDDAKLHGVYAFFCSDSCSAYLNRTLEDIGGFEPILTNEDYFAVARLLRAGHAIAYVADSEVQHSHRYTLRQEFQRYFDTGYVRAENPWVTELVGHAERRGSAMASRFLRRILRTQPWLVPYAVLQLGAKWLGYRAGYFAYGWPRGRCRALSSQRYYWTSRHSRHPHG